MTRIGGGWVSMVRICTGDVWVRSTGGGTMDELVKVVYDDVDKIMHSWAAMSLHAHLLKLRDDLRTRMGWGHVYSLQLLTEPERRAVLRQAADARGVFLGDEVMDFMLKRFSRDLGSLIQLLDQLDGYALQTQRAITIPLLKSMLENL